MNRFSKGDRVLVKAIVWTKVSHVPVGSEWRSKIVYTPEKPDSQYPGIIRPLERSKLIKPLYALIVGKSYRISGYYRRGYGYDDAGELINQTRHPVFMVSPLNTERYLKPYAALEGDIEKSF